MNSFHPTRRKSLAAMAATAWCLAPSAQAVPASPRMTRGPYYPPANWRQRETDWDADLTTVRRGGQSFTARGEHLALQLALLDEAERPLVGAEVEIWQCDVASIYRHPAVEQKEGRADPGFQGFGSARTDGNGLVRLRTIRPVAYPGRTPHIHVRVRHESAQELVTQLFVAGDPGNARDGLWRRLSSEGRAALAMQLQPAGDAGLRWRVDHRLVLAG